MRRKDKLKRNIKVNYVYNFIMRMDFTQVVWMIYLASKGMSLWQLGLLESIFHITSFCMEVPTGIIADVYGRKISRSIGRFISVISVGIMIYSNDFWMFALSFVASALSYNLESGAGEALLYDSLVELKEEEKYMKVAGKNEVFFNAAGIVTYLVGGYLASRNYMYAYGFTIVSAIIAFVVSLFFEEPKLENRYKKEKNPFKIMKMQVLDSVEVIKDNNRILFLIFFMEMMFVFGTSMFFYLQNYWKMSGKTELYIGIVFSITHVVSSLVAIKANDIENVIKEKGVISILPLITAMSIFGIALTDFQGIFYGIILSVEGIVAVALGDYINKMIPSESRATIHSLSSMLFSMLMITIFPMIGKIGDLYSLKTSFLVVAIVALIFAIVNIYLRQKD